MNYRFNSETVLLLNWVTSEQVIGTYASPPPYMENNLVLTISLLSSLFIFVEAMAAASNRFAELPPEEIQRLLDSATAKSTVKATKFGMKIFYGEFWF